MLFLAILKIVSPLLKLTVFPNPVGEQLLQSSLNRRRQIAIHIHTVLATAVTPMVLMTVYRALRDDFTRHRRLARWTLPIWLYVSVTGVVVYVMLYHVPGAAG